MIPMQLGEVGEAIGAKFPGEVEDVLVTGISTNSRTTSPGDLFVAIGGERFDGHAFIGQAASRGAAGAVISRAVVQPDIPCARVDNTIAALGRLAAEHRRRMGATVIAVTGSNGKTTTKGMIDHVLSRRYRGRAAVKSFNNHLGVPLTLLSAEANDDYLVVEIGSNAPGEVAHLAAMASPEIGVVTSVGRAHLEGLGGITGVVREKLSLLRHVRAGGLAVVNADLPETRAALGHPTEGKVELATFGTTDGVELRVTEAYSDLDGILLRINNGPKIGVGVCGRHNALNATATYAVCRRMNLEPGEIAAGLSTYAPADMRLNVVRRGEVTVIDDCYNANPSSMVAALELLAATQARRRVLVAGDMLELGSEAQQWHEHVGRTAAESGIELLIAVGAQAPAVTAAARAAVPALPTLSYEDSSAACEAISQWLQPGDLVLVKGSRAMAMERVVSAVAAEQTVKVLST